MMFNCQNHVFLVFFIDVIRGDLLNYPFFRSSDAAGDDCFSL